MPGSLTLVNRRALLASSAASLLLPGCAAGPRVASPTMPCLPSVRVGPERVIRAVAGLRPYRDEGFAVRAEPLGDKRLVHNYGHGGAGFTLSWGTARLAAARGLPGHQGAVAVIGAGVIGLTTARLVQEAGFPVTVYAAALPPETTSNVAGGQISPSGHYREGHVNNSWREQFAAAMEYSWRRFQVMVGDDTGVRWLPTYEQGAGPLPLGRQAVDRRALGADEHPFAGGAWQRYTTMYVEAGRYLRHLTGDVLLAGGRIVVRAFASPGEIASLPENLVFNCTGLGARALFGDQSLRPVKGQLAVLLPQPEVRYAYSGRAGYMFPRPDGIVLGGTWEHDVWDPAPQPEAIARIVEAHRQLAAGWRCRAPERGLDRAALVAM